MVLDKLPVPGRPTICNLDYSWAWAYCTCRRCGRGSLDVLLSFILSLLSLWETARYRLKYCLKGQLNSKQPTNQPGFSLTV